MDLQLRYCGLQLIWKMKDDGVSSHYEGSHQQRMPQLINESVSWSLSGYISEPSMSWVEYYRPSCASRAVGEVIERNNEFSCSLLWRFSGPSMQLGEGKEVGSSLEMIMLLRGICKLFGVVLFFPLSKITQLGRAED